MQTITTKYIPATNTNGSRIKATASSGISVIMPYRYDMDTKQVHMEAARLLMKKLDWYGTMICGDTKTGIVCVFDEDDTIDLPIITR